MPFLVNSADTADADPRAATFEAEITPNDSLGDDGFSLFIKITLGVVAALEILLLTRACWVIGLFLAFDAALLLLAFHLFRAREIAERVVVADGLVVVTRRCGRQISRRELRLFGLALERRDDPDYGCQSLTLRLRGERIEIARDLSPEERERFCAHFEAALQRAGVGVRTARFVALPLLAEARS